MNVESSANNENEHRITGPRSQPNTPSVDLHNVTEYVVDPSKVNIRRVYPGKTNLGPFTDGSDILKRAMINGMALDHTLLRVTAKVTGQRVELSSRTGSVLMSADPLVRAAV